MIKPSPSVLETTEREKDKLFDMLPASTFCNSVDDDLAYAINSTDLSLAFPIMKKFSYLGNIGFFQFGITIPLAVGGKAGVNAKRMPISSRKTLRVFPRSAFIATSTPFRMMEGVVVFPSL